MSYSNDHPDHVMTSAPSAPTNIPEPPPLPTTYSRKPANHIPGMVNPLICDDSQGDFGANPVVRPNSR